MKQYHYLIQILKQQLKANGFTYAKIAQQLDVSEASIKRMFSLKRMSLDRLEELCNFIDLSIEDLVKLASQQQRQTFSLTLEQEQELAANKELLLLAVCLMNRLSISEIRKTYRISNVNKLLNQLDRMKIIEVLPSDRVKLLISYNFSWIANGPIQKFFNTQVQADFLNCSFNQSDEVKLFRVGMLSPKSRQYFIEKLEQLAHEFNDYHEAESYLPLGERNGSGVLLAIRRWEYSAFSELRRND